LQETHPDKNVGDPTAAARFLAVQAAFRVLSNPARRAAYDLSLEEEEAEL
jgi:curved DNA-binding protein CbpA